MQSVKDFMEADHDRLDGIFIKFQEIKRNDVSIAQSLFSEFKNGLEKHIVWEEDILFPVFEEKTGMKTQGPTVVMRYEHTQIKDFLAKIHEKIQAGNPETDEEEKGMLQVLKVHNEKEENILYPWIDQEFSETDVKNFFEKINREQ